MALDAKDDITTFRAVRSAGEKAYKMAGLGPKDIEFAELHDCFTIAEIIACEDLGFVEKGQGGPYALAGHTSLTGERPINTSGGLKSKGHPVGATGVAQLCDVAMQIRGEAGERQLARNKIGLAQNLGGSGATAVVTILGRNRSGTVYTETVVHAAPEQFVADAPYQLAIVVLEDGARATVRIAGERVAIGDRVEFAEDRSGCRFTENVERREIRTLTCGGSVRCGGYGTDLIPDRIRQRENWQVERDQHESHKHRHDEHDDRLNQAQQRSDARGHVVLVKLRHAGQHRRERTRGFPDLNHVQRQRRENIRRPQRSRTATGLREPASPPAFRTFFQHGRPQRLRGGVQRLH